MHISSPIIRYFYRKILKCFSIQIMDLLVFCYLGITLARTIRETEKQIVKHITNDTPETVKEKCTADSL